MEKMMKDCMTPHPLLHTVTGIGIGLVLTNWLVSISSQSSMALGIVFIIIGVLGEFAISPGKRK